jgi:hypothetical protein
MSADDQQERPKVVREGQDAFSKVLGYSMIWFIALAFVFGVPVVTLLASLLSR